MAERLLFSWSSASQAKQAVPYDALRTPGAQKGLALEEVTDGNVEGIGAIKLGTGSGSGSTALPSTISDNAARPIRKLLAKALIADPDTLDGVVQGTTRRWITSNAADSSGNVDMAGSGWVNKDATNLPRSAGGTAVSTVIGNLDNAGNANVGFLENGGKAINRLYAKALAGNVDTADSIVTGTTRATINVTAIDGSARVDMGAAGVVNKNYDNLSETSTKKHFQTTFKTALVNHPQLVGRQNAWNPGFEDGSVFWETPSASGSALSVITDNTKAHTGNKYGQWTTGVGVASQFHQADDFGNPRFYEVAPGDIVAVSAWFWRESGDGNGLISITFCDKDFNGTRSVSSGNMTAASWNMGSVEGTVASNEKYVRVKFISSAPGVTTVFRVDDMTIRIQTPANDITDGNFRAGTNESGGKAINRLLAKALSGDSDSADGLVQGTTRRWITSNAADSSGNVDMGGSGWLNKHAGNLARANGDPTLVQTVIGQLAASGHAGSGMQESGGKNLNRLLAKALSGDSDSADGLVQGTTRRWIINTAADSAGKIDLSGAGWINKDATNLPRAIGSGTSVSTAIGNITDAGHAGSSMQESTGRPINKLLAKALLADPDTLDGVVQGTSRRWISNNAADASGNIDLGGTAWLNKNASKLYRSASDTTTLDLIIAALTNVGTVRSDVVIPPTVAFTAQGPAKFTGSLNATGASQFAETGAAMSESGKRRISFDSIGSMVMRVLTTLAEGVKVIIGSFTVSKAALTSKSDSTWTTTASSVTTGLSYTWVAASTSAVNPLTATDLPSYDGFVTVSGQVRATLASRSGSPLNHGGVSARIMAYVDNGSGYGAGTVVGTVDNFNSTVGSTATANFSGTIPVTGTTVTVKLVVEAYVDNTISGAASATGDLVSVNAVTWKFNSGTNIARRGLFLGAESNQPHLTLEPIDPVSINLPLESNTVPGEFWYNAALDRLEWNADGHLAWVPNALEDSLRSDAASSTGSGSIQTLFTFGVKNGEEWRIEMEGWASGNTSGLAVNLTPTTCTLSNRTLEQLTNGSNNSTFSANRNTTGADQPAVLYANDGYIKQIQTFTVATADGTVAVNYHSVGAQTTTVRKGFMFRAVRVA